MYGVEGGVFTVEHWAVVAYPIRFRDVGCEISGCRKLKLAIVSGGSGAMQAVV